MRIMVRDVLPFKYEEPRFYKRNPNEEEVDLEDLHGSEAWGLCSANESDAELIAIPFTQWGDYSGEVVTRSNHRVILEEFREEVIEGRWGYGTTELLLPLEGEVSEELADLIVKLEGYPLADEEDFSELELELLKENWSDWQGDNFRDDVLKALVGEGGVQNDAEDMLEAVVGIGQDGFAALLDMALMSEAYSSNCDAWLASDSAVDVSLIYKWNLADEVADMIGAAWIGGKK